MRARKRCVMSLTPLTIQYPSDPFRYLKGDDGTCLASRNPLLKEAELVLSHPSKEDPNIVIPAYLRIAVERRKQ
jgi:hypothetical protein